MEKDNLQLKAQMTHLDVEVRCGREIEGKLKMELEEARTSLVKMTLSSKMIGIKLKPNVKQMLDLVNDETTSSSEKTTCIQEITSSYPHRS